MSRLWGALALAPLGLGVVGLLQCGLDEPGQGAPEDSGPPIADATIDAPDGGGSAESGGDSSTGGDGGVDASCVGIDASADPKNCGGCGHDCLGGGCKAGACLPQTFATNEDVVALSLDAMNVYWLNQANGGLAERCPIAGCPDAGSSWAQAPTPRALALDTQNAYWTLATNPCRVERATKGGPLIDVIGPNQLSPGPIVVDDGYLYWSAGGNLTRYAKEAGAAPTSLAPTQIGAMILGKGTLFWSANSAVHSCPTPDCATTTDLTGLDQANVKAIAADDTFVYWVRGDSILRCATAGCGQNPTLVGRATTQSLGAIALDGTDVYVGADSGMLARCAKTGCGVNPVTLATGGSPVTAIAVDAVAVYWSAGTGGGGVRKLAK
jgi:hypothetical protein